MKTTHLDKFGLFIFVWANLYTSGRMRVVFFSAAKPHSWQKFENLSTSGRRMWTQPDQQNVKILLVLLFLHYQFSLPLLISMGQWINSQTPNVTSIILLWYFDFRCRDQISSYWNVALWKKQYAFKCDFSFCSMILTARQIVSAVSIMVTSDILWKSFVLQHSVSKQSGFSFSIVYFAVILFTAPDHHTL